MVRTAALLVSVTLLAASAAAAAPVKARISSGIGIVLIPGSSAEKNSTLTIFKAPSLGRITGIDAGTVPSLAQSIISPEGTVAVIVTSKKSGWYRIVYDDGEREGWIENRSSYQFYRWDMLFRNRAVSLIGGLRKEFYLLRKNPDSAAESIAPLGKGSRVTSLQAEGDWIRVVTDSGAEGWIRWRDENSRLVVKITL